MIYLFIKFVIYKITYKVICYLRCKFTINLYDYPLFGTIVLGLLGLIITFNVINKNKPLSPNNYS